MFTRCPHCSAVFRVTATILQMAEGEVRCGACGVVFNALHTLVDDWTGADFMPANGPHLAHPDAPVTAETPPLETAGEPASETLEFDVPEDEWQRYFISPAEPVPASEGRNDPALGDDFNVSGPATGADAGEMPLAAAGSPPDEVSPPSPPSLEEETADTDTWQSFLREVHPVAAEITAFDDPEDADDAPAFVLGDEERAPEHHPQPARTQDAAPEAREPDVMPPFDVAIAAEQPVETGADEALDAERVDDQPPADSGDSGDADELPASPADTATVLDWGPAFPAPAAPRPRHTARWLAASIVAALVLAGQALHQFRDRIAADPAWGSTMRAVYARLGLPLYPAWPLDAYEIRSVKAIADNTAAGALDIVAEVAVGGARPVGLPMVRVVLRDRWSNTVASGVFDATHYLAEPAPAGQVYTPGSMIPLHITLADPGAAAQGYEVDLCMPDRIAGLRCQAARDPFRR